MYVFIGMCEDVRVDVCACVYVCEDVRVDVCMCEYYSTIVVQ